MALWTGMLGLPFLALHTYVLCKKGPTGPSNLHLGRVMVCSSKGLLLRRWRWYGDGRGREGQGLHPPGEGKEEGFSGWCRVHCEMEGQERSLPVGVAHIFPHPHHNQHTHAFTICTRTQNGGESETAWLRLGLEPNGQKSNTAKSIICHWDHSPGFSTQWSWGSWCLIMERIQWEAKW